MIIIPTIIGAVATYAAFTSWLECRDEQQQSDAKVILDVAREERAAARKAEEAAEAAAREEQQLAYWDGMKSQEAPILYFDHDELYLGVVVDVQTKGVVVEDHPGKMRHFLRYEDLTYREASDEDVDNFLAAPAPSATPIDKLNSLFDADGEEEDDYV